VDTAALRRLALAPVALFAAIAIAAGGGSSPWSVRPSGAGLAARPAIVSPGVSLEHIELVALRALAAPSEPVPPR
jgi:hypothetical protein